MWVSQAAMLRRRFALLSMAAIAALSARPARATTQNSTWTNTGGTGLWFTSTNWNPNGSPNNGTGGFTDYNVTVNATGGAATLNGSATIDNLTLGTGGVLDIPVNNTLTIIGTTVTDNGSIVIDSSQQGGTTILLFNANTLLTGSGTITLDLSGTNAQFNTGVGDTVTQDTSHTINGFGNINASLINNGTVNANVSGQTLSLQTSNMTNNATFEATGGGILNIGGIAITQGVSGLTKATAGTVNLTGGTTITGGTLNTASGGIIQNSAGTNTIGGLTNSGLINILVNTTLNVAGNLTDNGTITVDSGQQGGTTILSFNGGTLSGSGNVVLDLSGTNAQLNGSLTQAAAHTISGFGQVNAALTNNGLVNANVNGGTLALQTSAMTNNLTFEATGGGTLNISGITVTQGASGAITAAAGSVVDLSNATVSTGTLSSAGTGIIQVLGTSTLSGGVTNSAAVNIPVNNTLNVSGNLVDNGTIVIDSNQAGGTTILSFSGGTLSGTGTVVVNTGSSNAQLNGTLTQSAGHTITGFGQINAALTNNGVVNANVNGGTLTFQTSAMTNNLTFEASSGGTMNISGITVTQGVGGLIFADHNSAADFTNATITGGTLNTAANTAIPPAASNVGTMLAFGTSTFTGVTNNGAVGIPVNNTLNITGTLTDNGSITVNTGQAGGATVLSFAAGSSLGGTGTIILNSPSTNAQLNGTVIQAANHSIVGFGQINATLSNAGTVNANLLSSTLFVLSPTVTNTNLMEATNGGILQFDNGTVVTNTGATIQANGGNVNFQNGTIINGGTLTAVTPNVITVNNLNAIAGFSAQFNGATVSSGTQVNIPVNQVLSILGTTWTNNGTILVNTSQSGGSTLLNFGASTSISGSGTITLNSPTNNAQLNTASGKTITIGASQTVNGFGQVNASLINNGTINANVLSNTLFLQTNNMTNNATMEATAGATLNINGITVTQSGGTISAATGSTVSLNNATIATGTLSTAGTGSFQIIGTNTLTGPITSNAVIQIPVNDTLNVTGNLVDNSSILVNTSQSGGSTVLSFSGTTLSGTGTVTLNSPSNNAQLNGTLTQSAGHSIVGFGQINAALTNNSIVNSNVNFQTLTLQTSPMTNNATFEATNGATLTINGITVTQSAGGVTTAGASSGVTLTSGATISGGTINGAGAFSIIGTDTLASVTSSTSINIPVNNTLNISGNLVNNGTVTVNTSQSGGATVISFNGGTLSGSGNILLNSPSNNAQVTGSLTQSNGHTINGFGDVAAAMTNNGLINANANGQSLFVQPPGGVGGNFINGATGVLEASSGGILVLSSVSGGTFTNNNTISALTGSQVQLASVSITGGTLNSAGTGSVVNTNTATLTNVTNAGAFSTNISTTTTLAGTFTNTGTFNQSSTLNASGSFSNSGTATIGGTQSWAAGATLTNTAGSTTFNTDVGPVSTSPLIVNVSGGTAAFASTQHLSAVNVSGAGLAQMSAAATPAAANVLNVTSISFTGASAKIDLTNNEMITTTTPAVIRGDIAAHSLITSITTPLGRNLGYKDLNGTQTEVRYTLLGDTDLNGAVNVGDLGALATNYGTTAGALWSQGDFNYDAKVDVADLGALATNYNVALGFGAGSATVAIAEPAASTAAAIPEPASVVLIAAGALGLCLRRQRRLRVRP